ncbi:energy transducer TonB [Oceanospirillum sediminis]|uniref:Energy transducer TonB n=1 Tax=Oceanospirillum sediminis TaxID=2760088 RepID=A0A839IPU2_9GAMM|nr:energy transducer TonB [Oceanospirillum sediminis]MBB1486694.1 energy transducer TonB [Oceanospirillum sediminis]
MSSPKNWQHAEFYGMSERLPDMITGLSSSTVRPRLSDKDLTHSLPPVPHPDSQVTSQDRLAFTLFLTLVVYFLLWAGIPLNWPLPQPDKDQRVVSSLQITLVRTPSEPVTEPVNFVAEQDQQGSGQTDIEKEPVQAIETVRATAPAAEQTLPAHEESSVPPDKVQTVAEEQPESLKTPPRATIPPSVSSPVKVAPENTSDLPETAVITPSIQEIPAKIPAKVESEAKAQDNQPPVTEVHASEPEAPADEPQQTDTLPEINSLTDARALLARSVEIARLEAEQKALEEQYARRPKVRTLSTVTARATDDIFYLRQWQEKIERVGNLNYPEKVRTQKLSGRLRVLVSLNSDGTVREIQVLESSGHPLLDQAAIDIVQLSAPFAPFPLSMRERTDILEIIRTWQFGNGNLFGETE